MSPEADFYDRVTCHKVVTKMFCPMLFIFVQVASTATFLVIPVVESCQTLKSELGADISCQMNLCPHVARRNPLAYWWDSVKDVTLDFCA